MTRAPTRVAHCRRRALVGVLLAAAALVGCDRPGASAARTTPFKGVDITGATYAQALALPDQNGTPRTLADFKGKVTVVFFGYTQCPDVCPTTMLDLARIKKTLGADGDRLQGVFVTIDPARDTPALLKAYLGGFDPSFVALRGSAEQTVQAAKEFKVYFEKVPGPGSEAYTFDHTAGSFVFDPTGKVRLFERYGEPGDAMAGDVKALLAGA